MRAAADVLGIDLLTGLRIKLAVFDSMLGFFVDLMKIGSSPAPTLPGTAGSDTRPATNADIPSKMGVGPSNHLRSQVHRGSRATGECEDFITGFAL
jgi:hypothetical protein